MDSILIAFGITTLAGFATFAGSLLVLRAHIVNTKFLTIALAFAAGAMIYVSFVEIFTKSHDAFLQVYPNEGMTQLYVMLAFFSGVGLLLLLDRLVHNPHATFESEVLMAVASGEPQGSLASRAKLEKVGWLTLIAITAHNIPEGMATFITLLEEPTVGLSLALAIAIHNIPEGMAIAIPLYFASGSIKQPLLLGLVASLAEPLGALLSILIFGTDFSPEAFGWLFGVIAGVMVFLSLDELLPVAREYGHGHLVPYSMLAGMLVIGLSLVLFAL